jgi:uncharacterized protein (TIGR03437 family)
MCGGFSKAVWCTLGLALVTSSAKAQTPNTITAAPAVLAFQYQLGATTLPAVQTLQVTSVPAGAAFTVAVTGAPFNAAWLLLSASSGTAPSSLKAQVNPTGLSAGTYAGTITIAETVGAPAPSKTIAVTLVISSPPPTLVASPAALNFNYIIGNPIPDPSLTSPFVLASNGTPLSATIAASTTPWLKTTPTGSISLAGLLDLVTVTVNPSGLLPKVYTATVTVNAPGAANKTLALTVTLTVNAAVPQALGTFPIGLIQGSAQSIVTLLGTGFYAKSTVAATGFTPTATITVTDSAVAPATASETLGIPAYAAGSTILHIPLASTFPSGVQTFFYAQALTAAGGTSPYTWSLSSGALPPGVALVGSALAGVPIAPASYNFTLQVTDSAVPFPATTYQAFKVTIYPTGSTVLAITTSAAPLPSGQVATAYNQTLTASGGTAPYTWSAVGLPVGIVLSAAGVLSGAPSSVGLTGPLAAAQVSSGALLVTVPVTDLANPGVLRMAVTTPTPGGGISNDAQLVVYGPAPQISGVVNSASFQQGTVTPGEIITIFGVGLGPAALAIFNPTTPPIPTSLPAVAPSTSLTIGGVAAPLIYTSAEQISAIVPYTVGGASAAVVVTYGGLPSLAFTVGVAPVNPGMYTIAASGQGQAAVLNYNLATNDYTVNSAAIAAAKGSIVVLYLTGAGAMSSGSVNTLTPMSPAIVPNAAVTVTIGGQPATINGAQAAPGSVPGVLQINVVVPALAASGAAIPVTVNIGGVDSQANITMAIK